MNAPKRLILAGGSGFLGRVLADYFQKQGWEAVILTRFPKQTPGGPREIFWDGAALGPWAAELEGAAAVVNLAGKSVDCRYHAQNRKEILRSRLEPTRVLGEAIARCANPPPVWLNASTATIYKHSLDQPMSENGAIGATPAAKDAFSVEVAREWERVLAEAKTPRTRKVALRTAMVLGLGKNSVFPTLRRLVRLGLGGKMASGRQYVSWIHQTDFCRAVEWLIESSQLVGPVNLAAPNPVPNTEMMRMLRRVCGGRIGLPAAAWMLEVGAFFLRTETELIIKSRRVIPGRLLESGFQFQFPVLEGAFQNLASLLH